MELNYVRFNSILVNNQLRDAKTVVLSCPIDLSPVIIVLPSDLNKYSNIWKKIQLKNFGIENMKRILHNAYTQKLNLKDEFIKVHHH